MDMKQKNWRAAFQNTLPVLMGYLTMGAAAGILLSGTLPELPGKPLWALFSSALSISGALQFIITGWIKNSTPLTDVILLTIFLNLRYAMYGLSLIDRFEGIPRWKKYYLIWTLTDETFALQCADHRKGEDSADYCLKVAFLDHCYWFSGVTAGAVIGSALPFSTKGIDFAMTALFIVILTDQVKSNRKNRLPAVTGAAAALLARVIFSTSNMLIPAMVLMIAVFLFFRKKFESFEDVKS